MPKRSNKFRRQGRRGGDPRAPIPTSISGGHKGLVPSSRRVTIRVGQRFALDSASGAYAERLFALNDLFDPESTGGSDVAIGVAAYANLYNQYRVRKCKVELLFSADTALEPSGVAMAPTNTSTAFASVSALASQYGMIGQACANYPSKMVMTVDMDRFFAAYGTAAPGTTAATTASPTNICVLHVGVEALISSQTTNVTFYALLTFEVDFFGLKIIT